MNKGLVVILLFLGNCLLAIADERPNVIIFIADDVSWDDFGCYGNRDVKTPNIDRISKDGIIFNNFYLTASSCSPSRNSILTGRYPHNTGAAELHTQPPEWMLSLPELLKNEGYYTALCGKHHLGKYADRGFDVEYRKKYADGKAVNGDGGEERWEQTIVERAAGRPFFFWFASHDSHRGWGPNVFSGTHDPEKLTPPPYLADSMETRKDLAAYYDEVYRFDHYIGRAVDKLKSEGIYENTMLIIMADNGRPFPHSKTRVNDRGMKSPFIVIWPKGIAEEGSLSESLVSAIDIAPTVMSIAGVEVPEQFQGESFERLFIDPSKTFRNYVFAEHNWHDFEAHERMVRNKDFMYILNSRSQFDQRGPSDAVGSPAYRDLKVLNESGEINDWQKDVFIAPRPSEELYDMQKDLHQFNNLYQSKKRKHKMELKRLSEALNDWMESTGDSIPENLTPDWRTRGTHQRIEGVFRVARGEMPGASRNAAKNNNKGPF